MQQKSGVLKLRLIHSNSSVIQKWNGVKDLLEEKIKGDRQQKNEAKVLRSTN